MLLELNQMDKRIEVHDLRVPYYLGDSNSVPINPTEFKNDEKKKKKRIRKRQCRRSRENKKSWILHDPRQNKTRYIQDFHVK